MSKLLTVGLALVGVLSVHAMALAGGSSPSPVVSPAPVGAAVPTPKPATTATSSRASAEPPPSNGGTMQGGQPVLPPIHAPASLDFGSVWDGQSARRTFMVKPGASGVVGASPLAAPFRIEEMRVMGIGASGPASTSANMAAVTPALTRNVRLRQRSAPWSLAGVNAGEEVQIDVLFEPRFNLFTMAAGQKSAVMNVTGPGPKGTFALAVPLGGMFNGLQVGGSLVVDEKEVLVPFHAANVGVMVTVAATSTEIKGTIHGGALPPGVSVTPVQAHVAAGTVGKVSVPFVFDSNTFKAEGGPVKAELVLDGPQGSVRATFTLVGLPPSKQYNFSREDCGIRKTEGMFTVFPDGHVTLDLSGYNRDLVNTRHVIVVLEVVDKPVVWAMLHVGSIPSGGDTAPVRKWDSRNVNSDFGSRFSPLDFPSAVRGGLFVRCALQGSATDPAPF